MNEELASLRTENGKLYGETKDPKTGAPRYTQESVTGPIHFKESYSDSEGWQDIDRTYAEAGEIKGVGKVLIYPKLPNIVTVFQDICGYQIQSRSNPDHIARVELVSVDGQPVTTWLDTAALKTYVSIHPYRVGIWKDFSKALSARSTTMRWKVTELGDSGKDSHPFSFRETPEAYSTADLTGVDLESAKVAIETARTRIDDTSWHWDEIIPATAKLVDTDYSVAAGADDGSWIPGRVLYTTSSDVGKVVSSIYHSFFIFKSISVPAGSTINSATISYYISNITNIATVASNIYLNDVDDAEAPNNASSADGKDLTTAFTACDAPSMTENEWWTSDSIVPAVQEVVDRDGWASGNDMMVIHKDDESSYNSSFEVTQYAASPNKGAKLTLTWTEPSTGHPASKRMGGIPFAALRRGVW